MSEDLTGMILVAAPVLRDPNFRRTILFLSQHSPEEGAVGVVLNRPMESRFQVESLSVELYSGGPVQPQSVLLASLQWRNSSLLAFHSFDTSDPIPEEWHPGLRAFAGYAGWSPGQLENEIEQNAWLVLQPSEELISPQPRSSLWLDIMHRGGPLLRLLAEAPDDPSLN